MKLFFVSMFFIFLFGCEEHQKGNHKNNIRYIETQSLQEIEEHLCEIRQALFKTRDRKTCETLVEVQHRYYGQRCNLGGICVKAASIEDSCDSQGWTFKDGFSKEKCKKLRYIETQSLQEIEEHLCEIRQALFKTQDRKTCETLVEVQHRYYGQRCNLGDICVDTVSIEESCNSQGWTFKDGFSEEKCTK